MLRDLLVASAVLAAMGAPACLAAETGAGGGAGDANAASPPERLVLEGVPKVGFYNGPPRSPEDDPFPSCLRALFEYKGDQKDLTGRGADPWHDVHVAAMAHSGAAFRMGWDPKSYSFGATSMLALSPDPLLPFRRGLQAFGYDCEILLRRDFAKTLGVQQADDVDEATFRRRIRASLAAGIPVLSIGMIGPPECGLITGYDKGGDVLIGWDYFQSDPDPKVKGDVGQEPSGYYRKSGWYKDLKGIVLVGRKGTRPPARESAIRTLLWGIEILRTPEVRGYPAGPAAFTCWADTLLKDSEFTADDMKRLSQRASYHHDTAGMLAEARAWGSWWLHKVAEGESAAGHHEAAKELSEAATCFDDEHDLVWAIWEFMDAGGQPQGSASKMADSGLRGRVVPLIRLARRRDSEAADHLERAVRLMQASGDAKPLTPIDEKLVLEGVPKAGYSVHWCPLPGSLSSVLEYQGNPIPYSTLMGVSGAAFRRIWSRDDGGNVDLMYLSPEPHTRLFAALGYGFQAVPHKDREAMVAAIKASLRMGRPVLSFGIIGPPEAGLITGYSKGGDVLHGWSYFQGPEFSGYYEQADWYAKSTWGSDIGLITIGDRQRWTKPDPRETFVSTLKWAIDLQRTAKRPNLPNHVCGLAAYDAWADGLEVDADYPKDDPKVMDTRAMVHSDQCVMLDERREAATYLRSQAKIAPEAEEELKAAADLYTRSADLGGRIYPWEHGGSPKEGLADPSVRRGIAKAIREAKGLEAQAVALLEKALAKLEK